jgi:hypothetical protein
LPQPDVVLDWYGCKVVGAAEGCGSEHAIVGGPGLGGARENAKNAEAGVYHRLILDELGLAYYDEAGLK